MKIKLTKHTHFNLEMDREAAELIFNALDMYTAFLQNPELPFTNGEKEKFESAREMKDGFGKNLYLKYKGNENEGAE